LYSLDGVNYLSSGSISSPIRIPNLTNGVTYNITIKAVNTNGSSTSSNSVSVTPSNSGPLAPVLTSVTFKTTDTMTIAFTQASNGITITNYKYSIDGGDNYTAFSPVDVTSPVTISGLSSNTEYNISLKAMSAVGESDSSNTLIESTYANVNYVSFTETGSSTWTVPDDVTFVQYLVVGGGGGGGATYSDILVLDNLPFVQTAPSPLSYWVNSNSSSNTYGYFYKGNSTFSLNRYARINAPQDIIPKDTNYSYNRWYKGELVYYMNSSFPTTSNYFGSINISESNNDSGGGGGGAGGQVRFQTGTNITTVIPGTTYTIVVGAGGQGGQSTTNSETNGSPGGDSSFDTITSRGGSGGGFSRNMSQVLDTNKNGKGGNGGQGYGNLVGGSGGGQNNPNNYGRYNSGGPGASGFYINFDGSYQYYGPGGNGGVPNTVASGTTLANVGKGGNGTGATLNSFADGIDGGSGIVVLRYYT
jgi:hypothetical protein